MKGERRRSRVQQRWLSTWSRGGPSGEGRGSCLVGSWRTRTLAVTFRAHDPFTKEAIMRARILMGLCGVGLVLTAGCKAPGAAAGDSGKPSASGAPADEASVR